jgi:hypothetical protein
MHALRDNCSRRWPAFGLVLVATVLHTRNPWLAQTDALTDVNTREAQQNPISSLVSVPLQFNFNTGGGLEDQTFLLLNAQPVIPFRVNEHWNAISRTVVPIASVPGPDATRSSGVGDIQLQLYFTPSKSGSFVWGGGPVMSAPTATTGGLKTGSWAAGPTFVALTMPGPWVLACWRTTCGRSQMRAATRR